MTAPELRGALDGLKVLDGSDLARYKAAVTAGEQLGWGYYFPYLMSRNRPDRSVVLLGEDDGTLCIYLWRLRDGEPKLDLPVAPTPMNGRVLERCLERANDFNGDTSARILRIDAKDSEAVAAVRGLRVKERKSQYLYSPEAFADIGGRRYRTLRRNVVRVEALPGLEVEPYSPSHAQACHELLRSWGSHHREAHGTAGGIGGSRRVIDLASELSQPDVRGEVVFLDGRLCAFAFGGEIRPGVACFFDAKSDTEIPGLSYFHRYSFLSKLTEFSLVNDGSDVGRAGLRQLKDSLRPVEMHIEYRGTQTRD
jgi:hypothetical protein